jgi:hypothetical protein
MALHIGISDAGDDIELLSEAIERTLPRMGLDYVPPQLHYPATRGSKRIGGSPCLA